jgi:3-methyladenine DNA glycosylase AlkD
MEVSLYFELIKSIFSENGNHDIAEKQVKYMKNNFNYYGLQMKTWTILTKDFHQTHGLPEKENLQELIELCFDEEYRELQYFAIQTFEKLQPKLGKEALPMLEYMLTNKSWWDSVDWISKLVGKYFLKNPDDILITSEHWMASNYMWLQRSSIIFQLFYKDKTDFKLLTKYILQVKSSKEFFLKKAAGWALRQYSKTNPTQVIEFVLANSDLSYLTKKEALRLIKNN